MQDVTPDNANAPEAHPVQRKREAQRLSREGLAWKAGVSFKTIERIERGDVTPHRLTQESIARVLSANRDELFPEAEQEPAA